MALTLKPINVVVLLPFCDVAVAVAAAPSWVPLGAQPVQGDHSQASGCRRGAGGSPSYQRQR